MAMMFDHMWAFWVLGFFLNCVEDYNGCVYLVFASNFCAPSPQILEDFICILRFIAQFLGSRFKLIKGFLRLQAVLPRF
jgi:hypothetical protein